MVPLNYSQEFRIVNSLNTFWFLEKFNVLTISPESGWMCVVPKSWEVWFKMEGGSKLVWFGFLEFSQTNPHLVSKKRHLFIPLPPSLENMHSLVFPSLAVWTLHNSGWWLLCHHDKLSHAGNEQVCLNLLFCPLTHWKTASSDIQSSKIRKWRKSWGNVKGREIGNEHSFK